MIDSAVNGTTKVFTGKTDDVKVSELRGAVVVTAIATAFLTSKVTRKRVEEGKEPIIGFF